ncbi:hypothetical protein FRC12_010530 [Ceratobasidium sp. 428]|nr:hypothetical protein FRC09_008177 [Ceratobasidium sp. 395]KAG8790953.1 hypothetical protein FRC12_010530 [Ceratobasidium sp. 428]
MGAEDSGYPHVQNPTRNGDRRVTDTLRGIARVLLLQTAHLRPDSDRQYKTPGSGGRVVHVHDCGDGDWTARIGNVPERGGWTERGGAEHSAWDHRVSGDALENPSKDELSGRLLPRFATRDADLATEPIRAQPGH